MSYIYKGLIILLFSSTLYSANTKREDCLKKVPSWYCNLGSAECNQIVPFLPVNGKGYVNYPQNGEEVGNQYKSYIRRHVMMLVKYAADMVACQAEDWPGIGGQLGLGDMSEADGGTPTSLVNGRRQLMHPKFTHDNGRDMDIAYYQTENRFNNNYMREVCKHLYRSNSGRVEDAYRCLEKPETLDVYRTALFIANLHDSNNLRIIGVDGKIGPLVEEAINYLCDKKIYKGKACNGLRLAYEAENTGKGWYKFHHHHLHLSVNQNWKPATTSRFGFGPVTIDDEGQIFSNLFPEPVNSVCLNPDCTPIEIENHGYVH